MNDEFPGMERIRRQVRERGFDVVSEPAAPDAPQHGYTVGLTRRGLRDFILFGFSPDVARPVLIDMAHRSLDGEPIPVNAGLADVLPGMPAVLLEVPPAEAGHYLAAAHALARGGVRAIQIVWPDGQDLFPWQIGYDETFRPRQLVLNPLAAMLLGR